ncbi:MAG TPA: DUF5985 family protein [Acidimicrobiales bacterium]|jgi:hypothetical protein|nr:DUF5985 family protein [Acidimicrobiales bacterium]
MAEAVYLLCAITSVTCAVLLLRAYARTRTRLLLWSGLCFVGVGLNNVVLVVDLILVPDTDLSTWRLVPAAAGIVLLVYGLAWDAE